MLFCQLGRAHSLREITGGLRSCEGKFKHLGISAPSRSTLAYAGAKPLRPPMPGIDQKNVITALDLLRGAKDATGKVVVLGGGHVGAEVAEYLATKGRDVTIIEMLDEIATDMPKSVRMLLILSLKENGVKTITKAKAEKITKTSLIINKQGKEIEIPADSVVLALGFEADRSLEDKLGDRPILWVGDCVKPRKLLEAVREGFEAGAAV